MMKSAGKREIRLTVNGQVYDLAVHAHRTLVEVLRDDLGLTGTKTGCGQGECGTCTVLVDGKAVFSCLILAVSAQGKEILTIEGLAEGDRLHPIQQAFVEKHGFQCGYCTPGMIMATVGLLSRNRNPREGEVREAIAGHICRCGAYPKIIQSILHAAGRMGEE